MNIFGSRSKKRLSARFRARTAALGVAVACTLMGSSVTRLVAATDTSSNAYTGQPNIQYIYENPSNPA